MAAPEGFVNGKHLAGRAMSNAVHNEFALYGLKKWLNQSAPFGFLIDSPLGVFFVSGEAPDLAAVLGSFDRG
jgi:hypothetical protein